MESSQPPAATPPGSTLGDEVLPLTSDLPDGYEWSWESTWPEELDEIDTPGEQQATVLDNGCQLSHYVVRVSDVPLRSDATDGAGGGAADGNPCWTGAWSS